MGAIRTTEELLRSLVKRVRLLERRLAVRGAGTPASRLAMVGEMKLWPLAVAPDGWVLARGQALSRADYPDLFAAYGVTFGAGDGSTTFNLPDMRGRVPVGQDVAQTEFDVMGEKAGSKTHTLTAAEMPAHNHSVSFLGQGGSGVNGGVAAFQQINPNNMVTAGGGGPHNNLQPYIVVNYIIKA